MGRIDVALETVGDKEAEAAFDQVLERLDASDRECARLAKSLRMERRATGTGRREYARRAVGEAISAVLDAAEACERDCGPLLDVLWWILSTGRRYPARLRILGHALREWRGQLPSNASSELQEATGLGATQVAKHLHALAADPLLGHLVKWEPQRAEG